MPLSEDFSPMQGSVSFVLGDKALRMEADERVDTAVLGAGLECVAYLSDALTAVRGARTDNRDLFHSDLVVLYLATRIHGVSAAGMYLVALGLGKEAVHMERSQYEFFLRMMYYANSPAKAREFVESIPRSAGEFMERARLDRSVTDEEIKEIEELPPGERDFRSLRDALFHDSRFLRQCSDNPIIEYVLRNGLADLRNHWLYASSVLHASNLDMVHVVVQNEDSSLNLNIDSRHKYPNRAIGDFAQRCYFTALFVSSRFGIEVDDRVVALGQRLMTAVSPHLAEPTSVAGMFD